jgi:hypothetical protein
VRFRSRNEWLGVVCGLIAILIVLGYCEWRIRIQSRLVEQLESHLVRQDEHMMRQDIEGDIRSKNQEAIMKTQARFSRFLDKHPDAAIR